MAVRPAQLSKETVAELVLRSFPFEGVDVSSVTELDSYDDRNYYFKGTPLEHCVSDAAGTSPAGADLSNKEYVLKTWNSSETQARCEGRCLLLLYLRECDDNVPCPRPLKCKEGNFTVECRLGDEGAESSSLLTVQEYLPGRVMEEVDPPPYLLYEVGQAIGSIARNLQNFSNKAVEEASTVANNWDLKKLSSVRHYMHAVEDPNRKEVANSVISAFERNVVPKLSSGLLRCGLVHGDLNGMNLLVKSTDGILNLSGIIDFGDSMKTCYVFDFAVFIAYMMILKYKHNSIQDPLELAQLLSPAVSGFLHAFPLNSEELDCLYYSVLGRLCQSGVLGLHAYMETKNEYALNVHCLKAWKLMEIMLKAPKEEIDRIWSKKLE